MDKKKSEMSFEEALSMLEKSANALKNGDTTLDEALNQYEQGMQYYNRCVSLLADAKQKIEVYDKAKAALTDFEA